LAVIAGVLIVYALGSKIPLPGLDAERLVAAGASQGPAARFSVMALGLTPLLTVLVFIEFARLLIPQFRQWQSASFANAVWVGRIVTICAIVLAALQGFGVVAALTRIGVVEADNATILADVAALVGGTLVLIWLADRIVLPGVGNGFWLLWIAPFLAGLATQIAIAIAAMQTGAVTGSAVLISAAYLLIASAAVVVVNIIIARGESGQDSTSELGGPKGIAMRALIWSPLLANVAAGYIAALFYVVFAWSTPALLLTRLILFIPLIVLFVLAYARQTNGQGAVPWSLLALLQLVVCVVGEWLTMGLGLPWRLDGALLIVTVTVLTSLLRLLPVSRGAPATASA